MPEAKNNTDIEGLLPGLLVTLVIAVISFLTWWFLKTTWLKFSALLWAFVFSIIIVNARASLFEGKYKAGIEFAASRLLRWSIAALGLTVSASVWLRLGAAGLAMVLINLALILILSILFCKYVLKLDDALTLLIAAGTAICGATAIAAVGPALRAKAEEMGLAVATVTLFGLIAMFAYPFLFNGLLTDWLGNNPLAYGMWAGTGIHETAQVIAAASQVDNAVPIATSAKFIRIFMIGPFVLISPFIYQRFTRNSDRRQIKIAVPWFAVFFVIFSFINFGIGSLVKGNAWTSFNSVWLSPAVTFLLAWSFAGVGLTVKISTIRSLGLKAFLGGMVVAIVAGTISLLLVKYLWLSST